VCRKVLPRTFYVTFLGQTITVGYLLVRMYFHFRQQSALFLWHMPGVNASRYYIFIILFKFISLLFDTARASRGAGSLKADLCVA
jgi:hypothetical protein